MIIFAYIRKWLEYNYPIVARAFSKVSCIQKWRAKHCLLDAFVCARTRLLGQARATIGYQVYKWKQVIEIAFKNDAFPSVYKIPYRRALGLAVQPLGRVRTRAKVSCILVCKIPLLARARATIGYLVYNLHTTFPA